MPSFNCRYCSKSFHVPDCYSKTRGKFCSRQCYHSSRGWEKPVVNKCMWCNKDMIVGIYKLRKKAGKFCSRKCTQEYFHQNKIHDIERFFINISRKPHKDNCWIWGAAKNLKGYGITTVDLKSYAAHRYSWIIHFGQISSDQLVCHKCDNPSCVNPEHLFLGTQKDNIQDMLKKGRQRNQFGEKNNKAKLTENDVQIIREKLKQGISQKKIGSEFGVSQSSIHRIKHNICWSKS